MVEVIEIPAAMCPQLSGYFAISEQGVREMLRSEIQRDTQHAVELEKCNGATRQEQARRESAETALAHAQWWERWGPLVAAIGVTFGVVVGGVGGFELAHMR